jgi:hypothetical protein
MEAEPPKADLPKRNRRWYQFSLRTLLVVTVILALVLGWLGKKIEQDRNEREIIDGILQQVFPPISNTHR